MTVKQEEMTCQRKRVQKNNRPQSTKKETETAGENGTSRTKHYELIISELNQKLYDDTKL